MSDGFIPRLPHGRWQSAASTAMRNALFNRRQNPLHHTATFPVAKLGREVEIFAAEKHIHLGATDILATNKFLAHCQREAKGERRISENDLINFPYTSTKMEVYYDNDSFIYTNRKIKFIISPNYKLKKYGNTVNLITAGLVAEPGEFDNRGRYTKVR